MHQESTAIDVTVAHPTAFTLPSRYQEWVACRYTGPFRTLLEGRFHVGSSFQGGQKRLSCIRKKRRKLLLQAMGPILWCPWYISDASLPLPRNHSSWHHAEPGYLPPSASQSFAPPPLRNVQRSGKNFCGQRTILFQEKQQFLFICTDICTDIFHSWLLSMTLHCGKILQCIPNHPQHEFHEKSRFPCIIRKPEHAVIRYEPAFQSATKQRLDTISAKEETARIFPFCHYHLQTDGYTRTHNGTHSF